ncbi:MAG: hypothetical protein C4326_07870 [Ignavibacteria bacterium]
MNPWENASVSHIGGIATPAGAFPVSYLVEKTWGGFNDYGRLRTWLVPRVGIVKLHRKGVSFADANLIWELIESRIVTSH